MSYVLPYTANDADVLALQWTSVLATVVGPSAAPRPAHWGRLDVVWGVDARGYKVADHPAGGISLSPWPGAAAGLPFDAVISCVGFSGENTEVDAPGATPPAQLVGPLFWSTDSLQDMDLGVRGTATPNLRVLVSGGGDGAQQDVLRILTGGLFGQRLYEALGLDSLSLNLTDIVLADDLGRRAQAWSDPTFPPSRAYATWHDAYVQLANQIFSEWTSRGVVQDTADQVLTFPGRLTWLMSGDVPGYCYGLNRLLVLLVLRLYADRHRRRLVAPANATVDSVIRTGGLLISVHPTPGSRLHTCGGDCYGIPHDATGMDSATGMPISLGTFEVFVVRHGITPQPYFTPAPVAEQVTPFGYPR